MKTVISLASLVCLTSFTAHAMHSKIEKIENKNTQCTPEKIIVGQQHPDRTRKDKAKQKTQQRANERKAKYQLTDDQYK